MTRLLDTLTVDFLRHGQSEQNRNRDAYRGMSTDHVALTGKGRYQGRRAGHLLKTSYQRDNVTDVIWLKAPALRVDQTTEAAIAAIGGGVKIRVVTVPDLREIRLLDDELAAKLPRIDPRKRFFKRRQLVDETRAELETRVTTIADTIKALALETGVTHFAVSGHNTMTRCVVAKSFLGLSLDEVDGFPKLGNAHVWRCHAGRVEAIHPEVRLVAARGTPIEKMPHVRIPSQVRSYPAHTPTF